MTALDAPSWQGATKAHLLVCNRTATQQPDASGAKAKHFVIPGSVAHGSAPRADAFFKSNRSPNSSSGSQTAVVLLADDQFQNAFE
jgi:hypothetical protein